MKIATYNVNGIGARLPNLLAWLDASSPMSPACRSSRLPTTAFRKRRSPMPAMARSGMASAHGMASRSSRKGAEPVEMRRGLPGDPDDSTADTSRPTSEAHRRLPVSAERQPAARSQVRLQARLVRAPDRARDEALCIEAAGGALRGLQRRADGLRHLRSEVLAERCVAAAARAARPTHACWSRAGSMPSATASRRAHLHFLGLFPQSLGPQCGPADRSPAAQQAGRREAEGCGRGSLGPRRTARQRPCADVGGAIEQGREACSGEAACEAIPR